jgi:hypothetical protein
MQVADILIRNPSIKATTAMRTIIAKRKDWPSSDATLLRRLQVKWRQQKESLLTAARERTLPPSPLTIQEVMEGMASINGWMKQVVITPDLQSVIANATAFQRQIKQTRLVTPFQNLALKCPRQV